VVLVSSVPAVEYLEFNLIELGAYPDHIEESSEAVQSYLNPMQIITGLPLHNLILSPN
jgi:hypothetical protein